MKVEIIKEQMVSSCCSLEWLGGWAQVEGSAAVCSQQVRVCSVRQQQPDAGSVAADTGIVEGGVSPGVRVHLRTTKQQLLHTACVTSAGSQAQSRCLLHLGAQRPHAWRRNRKYYQTVMSMCVGLKREVLDSYPSLESTPSPHAPSPSGRWPSQGPSAPHTLLSCPPTWRCCGQTCLCSGPEAEAPGPPGGAAAAAAAAAWEEKEEVGEEEAWGPGTEGPWSWISCEPRPGGHPPTPGAPAPAGESAAR